MTLLAPAAAFLGLALPAILALYFLRIRRPPRVIPALHLWPDRILDRQANVPWQRLRPSWLLALQLLAVAALVIAALQPTLPVGAGIARHTIVLLDVSADMQAKDVQPSRLEEAKREVGGLIDQLGSQDRLTLVTLGPSPSVVASVTGAQDALRRALQEVRASNGPGDLSAGLALAAGLVRPGDDARALLYSDGILEPLSASFGDGIPFPVEYHRIGVSGENIGITSLVVRTTASSRAAFLHLQNFGQQARQASLEWRADDHLLDVRDLNLRAGAAVDLILPVPVVATVVSAHVAGGDVFAGDDTAVAIARAPHPFRVLLVTPKNVFLEQALRLRPDFQLDVIAPAEYRPGTGYAMTVFDRFAPARLPDGPLLLVDPPGAGAGGTLGIGRVRAVDAGDPLLAHVDLQDVHVARSQDLRSSTFGRALITSLQTPLLLVRDDPFRQALLGFDLHESDLPLRVAFPVLIENLTEWMLPASVPPRSFHPDDPVTIVPQAGATAVRLRRPDGSIRELPASGITTIADTDQTGLYTVTQAVAGHQERSWFTVNLFSDQVSQLKPVDRLTLPPSRAPATALATHRGQLDLWPWIALVGLGFVLIEWVAFHRGI